MLQDQSPPEQQVHEQHKKSKLKFNSIFNFLLSITY